MTCVKRPWRWIWHAGAPRARYRTEIRRGFLLEGEILRPPQMLVAQATPEDGQREVHLSHGMRRGALEG
jgi:hypothetical protein